MAASFMDVKERLDAADRLPQYARDIEFILRERPALVGTAFDSLRQLAACPQGVDCIIRGRLHETLYRIVFTGFPSVVIGALGVLTDMAHSCCTFGDRTSFVEIATLNICTSLLRTTREKVQKHLLDAISRPEFGTSHSPDNMDQRVLQLTWECLLTSGRRKQVPLWSMMKLFSSENWRIICEDWTDVIGKWSELIEALLTGTLRGWGPLHDEPDLYESLQFCISSCPSHWLISILPTLEDLLAGPRCSSVAVHIVNANLIEAILEQCPVSRIVRSLSERDSCVLEEKVLGFVASLLENLSESRPSDDRYIVNVVEILLNHHIGSIIIYRESIGWLTRKVDHHIRRISQQMQRLAPTWCPEVDYRTYLHTSELWCRTH